MVVRMLPLMRMVDNIRRTFDAQLTHRALRCTGQCSAAGRLFGGETAAAKHGRGSGPATSSPDRLTPNQSLAPGQHRSSCCVSHAFTRSSGRLRLGQTDPSKSVVRSMALNAIPGEHAHESQLRSRDSLGELGEAGKPRIAACFGRRRSRIRKTPPRRLALGAFMRSCASQREPQQHLPCASSSRRRNQRPPATSSNAPVV